MIAPSAAPHLPLQPFTEDEAVCSKCGQNNAYTTWKGGHEKDALVPIEHLERRCLRCDYRWPESTIDEAKRLGLKDDC